MRYQFMDEHRGQFSITAMARVLEVSTSGYYSWRGREESRRSKANRKLLVEIKAVHTESDATYGSPRIYRELHACGIRCSENRVARLMRLNDVRAKQMRRYKATTDSKHNLPVAENHLDRQFDPAAPNEVWAADITFIWTREGWLYVQEFLHNGGGDGPVLTPNYWLVDAVPSETGAGHGRSEDGDGCPARHGQPALS